MHATREKLNQLILKIHGIKAEYVFIGVGSVIGFVATAYAISFFWPKTVQYSYAADSVCYTNLALLPTTLESSATSYTIKLEDSVKVKSYPLFSKKSCVKLTKMNTNGNIEHIKLRPFNNPLFSQSLRIKTSDLPKLSSPKSPHDLVSTREMLTMKLDQQDNVFRYQLVSNGITKSCETKRDQVMCNLAELNLAQSQTYTLAFQRVLGDQNLGTIYETTIKTVDPVSVVGQSINPGSTIYDSPIAIEVNADKTIADYDGVKLQSTDKNGNTTELNLTIEENDKKLIVKPSNPLPREASLSLKISHITSTDKGFLGTPYELNFKTSGGPNVTAQNIGAYGIPIDKNFVLNFDYDITKNQDFNQLISLETVNGKVALNIIPDNKSITLKPIQPLPKCTAFTIRAAAGIKNIYGIPSSSTWSFSSRTLCQEVFSIGTSLQGRSIIAYRFGNGPSKVIYVGATHGDEQGSKYLLDSWVNELEVNYPKIPAHRTIIVVPLINPDGFAAKTRTNSRNVDLNRNFPANSWKSDVIMPGGNLVIGGGGTSALSEPESKAIADYILDQSPRLVLTYHSKGSMVVANEAGDSAALSGIYGKSSGYFATSESKLGTTFNYDTTGAMENWLYDKHSIPTLLIELKTHDTNEFSRNKAAMWSMATL